MFSRILSTSAAILAATQLVSAQTFTSCNPTEKKCPDDPALGDTITVDFTKGENDFFTLAGGTTLSYDDSLGAVFTIKTASNAPTISSTKYIFFGKIDVTLRASPGTAIVTSFVLQSDDLDEIDWEWLGGDTAQVQTNYFGKGDTTTYDRGAYHPVNTPQDDFHTYTIDWTKDYVKWYIDGTLVRTLNYGDAKGGTRFPQTPMQIKLGTWCAGGPDSPEGTREWAGGFTDFSKGPFNAYYQSITIQDYSNGVSGATSYSWSDGSDGSYGSINVLTDGSGSTTKSASASTKSTGSSKTTLSTVTTASSGGLTQATDGSDVTTTDGPTPTATISTAGATGASTSASASATATAVKNGALKKGVNVVIMGGAIFLGSLFL
ncbi:concanavalin A-like lectin/glucanase domain-containing protein [Xylariales sp. PMI_506]|nr:concanavalin A-like lectin/glucanase domain-containing protein [Xylariales sp. PMI_506]